MMAFNPARPSAAANACAASASGVRDDTSGSSATTPRAAKSICATCPVRTPCLDFALEIREPHGIWGGLNESERRALLEQAG